MHCRKTHGSWSWLASSCWEPACWKARSSAERVKEGRTGWLAFRRGWIRAGILYSDFPKLKRSPSYTHTHRHVATEFTVPPLSTGKRTSNHDYLWRLWSPCSFLLADKMMTLQTLHRIGRLYFTRRLLAPFDAWNPLKIWPQP